MGTARARGCLSAPREPFTSTMPGMSRITCVVVATLALTGCPSSAPGPKHAEPATDDRPLRIRIAQAEARRGDGITELVDIATHGALPERELALRGLGRTGGPQALETLRAMLSDPEPRIATAAAAAIGVAAAIDDETPVDATPQLLAVLARVPDAERPRVLEAIGRAADASAQTALVPYLTAAPPLAEAAAFALGRYGRRKIALDPAVRRALLQVSMSTYAAAYAIAREQPPEAADDGTLKSRLYAALTQDAPEIRAQALVGIAKHGLVGTLRTAVEHALLDRDWRVAVEAVRALAGDKGDDAGRDAVAAALARRYAELEKGTQPEAHVVMEALRVLAAAGDRPTVLAAVTALSTSINTSSHLDGLTRDWLACLAAVVIVHGDDAHDLSRVERCHLPDHLKLPLVAELVSAHIGTLDAQRTALGKLLVHADPRVRAAGLGAVPALWAGGSDADHRAAIATVVSALGAKDPIIAGSAVDAATSLYEVIGTGDHSALDAAVIERARREPDPELSAAMLELVGKQKLAAGADACRAGLTGHPVRVKAARGCLRALGEAVPPAPPLPQLAPPVDVTAVIGAKLVWHLVTTRGEIVIDLRPEVAPWSVATVVTLTRRGFYDGLEVHRVVPNFVAQGGDPTGSGAGGPGFTTPAEPGALADGPGFGAGGVGMADAGPDSGGSQWFVMHSQAPHLDGRYTWIGTVKSGQKSADALLIGDKVTRATVEVVP